MNLFDSFRRAEMQVDINQTRDHSQHTEHLALELEARVRSLEKSTQALWSLLKDKTGWTDAELQEHIKTVEAVQGPASCPSCGRKLLVQHGVKCSWCGANLIGESTGAKPVSEASSDGSLPGMGEGDDLPLS